MENECHLIFIKDIEVNEFFKKFINKWELVYFTMTHKIKREWKKLLPK